MKTLNYFLISVLLVLNACNESEDSNSPGSFRGYISYDLFTHPLDSDKLITNGVVIKVTGNGRSYGAVSSSKGYYEINNVDSGTYTLSFEPKNYSAMKYFNIKHNGIEWRKVEPALLPLPEGRIWNISAELDVIPYWSDKQYDVPYVFVFTQKSVDATSYRAFVGKDKNVSPSNYLYSNAGEFLIRVGYDLPIALIPVEELQKAGFKKGETVYIKVYISDSNYNFGYTDPVNNRRYYTAIDPAGSKTISIVLSI